VVVVVPLAVEEVELEVTEHQVMDLLHYKGQRKN
jgi:hypothetical protein